ncbi:MAG TPA: epimerase, partial [Pedococcus sp.]
LPVVPVPFGYDARLQFVHENDAIGALLRATTGPAVGITNIAGNGVITVAQAAGIAGRPIMPVPMVAAGLLGSVVKRAGLTDFSGDQLQFLAFGRGLDTARMRSVLGFEPEYTTRSAFEDYARGIGSVLPGAAALGSAVSGVAGSAAHAIGHVWAAGRND